MSNPNTEIAVTTIEQDSQHQARATIERLSPLEGSMMRLRCATDELRQSVYELHQAVDRLGDRYEQLHRETVKSNIWLVVAIILTVIGEFAFFALLAMSQS